MPFSIGQLLRVAGQGIGAHQEGTLQRKQAEAQAAERQRVIDNEERRLTETERANRERERISGLNAAESMLRHFESGGPSFSVGADGRMSGTGFGSAEEAGEFRSGLPPAPPPSASAPTVRDTPEGPVEWNGREWVPLTVGGERVGPKASTAQRPTEQQARFGAVLPRAETALEDIQGLLKDFNNRVPNRTLLGRLGFGAGQFVTPEAEQRYNQAAEALATAILRSESGAAITEAEKEDYKRQFIPSPGDTPELIEQKLESLAVTLNAMRRLAGPAAPVDASAEGSGGVTPDRAQALIHGGGESDEQILARILGGR